MIEGAEVLVLGKIVQQLRVLLRHLSSLFVKGYSCCVNNTKVTSTTINKGHFNFRHFHFLGVHMGRGNSSTMAVFIQVQQIGGASSMLLLTTGSYLQLAQDLTSVSVLLGESFVLFIEFKTLDFL